MQVVQHDEYESVSGGFGINTLLGENISRDISVSANYGKTNSDYNAFIPVLP